MKKFLALLLSALMVTALFAGCGDKAAEAPAAEKVINYANGAAPEVMDPISSTYAKTSIVMYNIYCGLTRIGANGVAELAYAESYEVSDDGLVWTFKIRKDS